jgi:hypothetical protein
MRIPIYQELILRNENSTELLNVLEVNKVGHVPCYFLTHLIAENKLPQLLTELEKAMNQIGISPRFPYPIYIISEHLDHHNFFPTAQSVEDLPKHFFKKVKRPGVKESQILSRNTVLLSKVNNQPCEDKMQLLKAWQEGQKKLSDLSKELFFYQTIFKKRVKK